MALRSLNDFSPTSRGTENTNGLFAILTELQGLKFAVVTGANANTDITVTGIATEDTLVAVVGIDGDNATLASTVVDRKAATSITAANTIQCTASTAAERLLVVWYDKA